MEDLVILEMAKKLKEKGFREECLCHYVGKDLVYNIESPIANNQFWFSHNKYDNIWHRDNVDAPTISQVLKWLRDKFFLHISQKPYPCEDGLMWMYVIRKINKYIVFDVVNKTGFVTEEEASVAGIKYSLDNLI